MERGHALDLGFGARRIIAVGGRKQFAVLDQAFDAGVAVAIKMHDLQAAPVFFGEQRQDRGIAVADDAVVRAVRDHALERLGVAAVAGFGEIAKRLIDFPAAIFVHGLPVAGFAENALDHVIERLRAVAAGADAENFQLRRRWRTGGLRRHRRQ